MPKQTRTTRKPTTPKKRNPQDATLRNIRALKRRVAALEADVKLLLATVAQLAETGPSR